MGWFEEIWGSFSCSNLACSDCVYGSGSREHANWFCCHSKQKTRWCPYKNQKLNATSQTPMLYTTFHQNSSFTKYLYPLGCGDIFAWLFGLFSVLLHISSSDWTGYEWIDVFCLCTKPLHAWLFGEIPPQSWRPLWTGWLWTCFQGDLCNLTLSGLKSRTVPIRQIT